MDKEETKVAIDSCQTAWGWVGIATSPDGLLALTLPEPTQERSLEPLLERLGKTQLYDDPRLDSLKRKLQHYFDGQRVLFDEPLDLGEATAFQRRVWLAVRDIPYGETRSYGQIARQVGSPGAARAVGQAMAANPLPIVVPCHRVIGSDGDLRGFGGGLDLKQRLLEMERALKETPGGENQSGSTVACKQGRESNA
jgi:methylated-DNA-[protein]-cysteine S-methyltransferase